MKNKERKSMHSVIREINNRVYVTKDVNIDAEIKKCQSKVKKAVEQLEGMDYLYMGSKEFDLEVFLSILLENHPLCEETMFSARTGKLVISREVIDYTIDEAEKDMGYENLEELKEVLNLLLTITENTKSIEILNEMKSRKRFTPRLKFDNTTNLVVSSDKLDFESEIIQRLLVLKDKKTKKISFNECYLKILTEKLGVSDEMFEECKLFNDGLISDMPFDKEVKYISLLVNEHIYSEKIAELSRSIFNGSYVLKPLLESEILKEGTQRISEYIKGADLEKNSDKILSMDNYQIVLEQAPKKKVSA